MHQRRLNRWWRSSLWYNDRLQIYHAGVFRKRNKGCHILNKLMDIFCSSILWFVYCLTLHIFSVIMLWCGNCWLHVYDYNLLNYWVNAVFVLFFYTPSCYYLLLHTHTHTHELSPRVLSRLRLFGPYSVQNWQREKKKKATVKLETLSHSVCRCVWCDWCSATGVYSRWPIENPAWRTGGGSTMGRGAKVAVWGAEHWHWDK